MTKIKLNGKSSFGGGLFLFVSSQENIYIYRIFRTPMTINQALDKLLTTYAGKDLSKFPDINTLRVNLIELKLLWGGNLPLDNSEQVKRTIKAGKKK